MYKSLSFSKLSIVSDLMHPSLLSSCSKSFRKFIYLIRIQNTVMEWSWEIFHWCVLSFIKDVTLAKMVALHCYVLHGGDASQTHMEETVKALIPNNSISKENGKEYWVNMAESYFDKVSHFTIYFEARASFPCLQLSLWKCTLSFLFATQAFLQTRVSDGKSTPATFWSPVRRFNCWATQIAEKKPRWVLVQTYDIRPTNSVSICILIFFGSWVHGKLKKILLTPSCDFLVPLI